MPVKRASRKCQKPPKSRSSQPTKKHNPVPPVTPVTEQGTDNIQPLNHSDFTVEFRRLKSRKGVFEYWNLLWELSSLEIQRLNLRFNEDAKRFLRLHLSRNDIHAVQEAYEMDQSPRNSNTLAFQMLQTSHVSSINQALQYYCTLHKLERMIDDVSDQDIQREFVTFQKRFAHAFDIDTGVN